MIFCPVLSEYLFDVLRMGSIESLVCLKRFSKIAIIFLQNMELTSEAMEFLKGVFSTYDGDKVR